MSGGEILVIVLVAYIVLGPKKIPEIARMIGKGINELRRATDDIRNEITRDVDNFKKDTNINIKDPFIPDAYKKTANPGKEKIVPKEENVADKCTEPEMK
jgi:Tat protein translocase TatB subunit